MWKYDAPKTPETLSKDIKGEHPRLVSSLTITITTGDQGSNCEKWTGGVSNTVGTKKLGGLGGLQWNDQGNWGG